VARGVVELITATKQCEGQVVDKFPLRQYLGETENSTVFQTERENGEKAAIKFVPVEAYEGTKQLAYWKRAAQLSHPHLLKIFDSGRCQLSGCNQVYAVMEYADENLSEILPSRALTADEAREMLGPLLDCLGYLHGGGFVHGHLRPGNIMATNNELKLSSDGIRQAGEAFPSAKKRSAYDPPEAGIATLSASADVWSLGITLVEVLTQRTPDWETSAGEPVVPATLPEPFRDVARHCLKRDPNARWTVPQIKTRLNQKQPSPPPVAVPPPAAKEAKPTRNFMPLALAAVVVLAIVGATVLFRHKSAPASPPNSQQAVPKAEQMGEVPAKPAAGQPGDNNAEATASSPGHGDVVRQLAPKISPSAQRTIRGRIRLRVRAHVDPSGNVTRADLVSAGPSQYFARLVMDAAREWKFVPSSQRGERRYMLHFDLTRKGNSARAELTK
jgi:eukaryotic-like serine/threonine-protein kinase